MKLTQQQEAEIYKVHDTYWHSYLSGDVSTMSDLLSENYSQVGSAEEEVFDSKALAVQFLHDTIEQVAGKLEMRNRMTTLQPLGELVMVHERCDLFARSKDNWFFYTRFRASTIMKYQQDGWKFIHQHSSFPDAKTEEGQNVAIDKITAENNQLREAVKRRTIELEYKNRELEIEAALERVRARTMAMQQQDELIDVITLLADQLVHLGVDLGVANFSNGLSYKDWDLWLYTNKAKPGKQTRRVFCPWIDHPYFHEVKAAIENFNKGIEFSVAVFGKADKDSFLDYVFAYTTFKNDYADLPDSIKEFLYNSPGYTWSAIVLKDTWVSICKYDIKPFTDKQNAILRRFTHAFGQAYTRFLDLQKAEAQTREAQIELSLEQVRARSLAMKCSDEMLQTSDVMFTELEKLSINALRIGICTIDGKTGSAEVWSRSENKEQKKNKILGVVPNGTHSVFDNMVKAWKEKKPYYSNTRKGKEVIDYYKKLSAHLSYPLPAKYNKQETITTFFFTEGSLNVVSLQPLTEEEMQIMIRFAIVFGQIYQRFLDLQKAEAQAREAQIELSLERVRAKTMAMHNSADVGETASVMEDELKKLGIVTIRCGIGIMHKTGDMEVWTISTDETNKTHIIIGWLDMHIHPLLLGAFESWSKKNASYSYELKDDDLFNYYNAINNYPGYPIRYDTASLPNLIHHNEFYFPEGILFAFSLQQLTEDQRKIFKRFAGVFGQTYRRYLDLQKAEAQAREAQIEAAVERVRAQSMAMHQTADFDNVNKELFTQLKWLNVQGLTGVSFYFFDEDGEIRIHDLSSPGNIGNPNNYSIKFSAKKYPVLGQLWQDYKMLGEYTVLDYPLHKLKLAADEFKTININVANAITQGIKNKTLTHQWCAFAKISGGGLGIDLISAPIEETKTIAIKMAGAFNLAYQRFLDLQKAEAQTRESQIQLALERVRARTMAMQKSEELLETTFLLFEQFKALGETSEQFSIGIFNEADKVMDLYTTMYGAQWKEPVKVDLDEPVAIGKIYAAWKNKKKSLIIDLSGNDLKRFNAFRKKLSNIGYKEKRWVIHAAFFSKGVFTFSMAEPSGPEIIQLLERFATVFEQTYTRFVDLQKAEEQVREAQIEAGLERVRSRSLAMHKTSELQAVIHTVHKELLNLNIAIHGGSFIAINSDIETTLRCWGSGGTADTTEEIEIPLYKKQFCTNLIYRIKKGPGFFTETFTQKEKKDFFTFLFKHQPWAKLKAKQKNETLLSPGGYTRSCLVSQHTSIFIINHFGDSFSEADNDILKRFGKVFDQTYTRFLDLQKAEAQAREATIEAALERVRSRTMAMQRSEELQDAAILMFDQMKTMNVQMMGCGFNIWDDDRQAATAWMTGMNRLQPPFKTSSTEDIFRRIYKSANEGESLFVEEQSGKALTAHYKYMASIPAFKKILDQIQEKGLSVPSFQIMHCAFFSQGYLMFITLEPVPGAHDIFKRFAKIFEQTYTRFLDLQKAEAQARESQIELSLERVRAKTMAMHNSNDVGETAAVLVDELKKLGVETIRCGIGIMHHPGDMELWTITTENDKTTMIIGWLDMNIHPLLHGAVESWLNKNETFYYELKGDDLLNYFNAINHYPGYPFHFDTNDLPALIHHNQFYFAEGTLFVFSLAHLSEEQRKILSRFAKVFGQTYRRYMDLQKAEAQAREAQIETGLEKVRSRTLAMQKSDELADTSIVIFEQLINLGIAPNRLFIGIIKEETHSIEAWATNEDGTKIHNHFTLHTDKNKIVKKMYEGWKQKKTSITIDMQGEELQNYFHYLADEMQIPFKDGLSQKRRVQTIAYFGQGFIGMASPDEQPEETSRLLERFAAVFNLTYTRFNDLKIAEAHAIQAEEDLILLQTEKKKAEDALVNLQAAQKQLVQSEKMASLGELTAGIAHEIQNPLNFVNNFSEVSKELLDELKVEIENGNVADARSIMNDVILNLEKINHHGKRADAIVKGMLQHSQSSSGKKELTDINTLCDEYLRLSYHGLRGKDKSFNATLKTNFDTSIGNINIISQDMGRVILNLLTNAFYVVHEKKKSGIENYEPTVSISTKKIGDKVEIKVTDNGNGIPPKVLDKIFQPFFTTKPTGQGTGLGLSLSYDLIKAHGGEISVTTKVEEGTTFIIQLPA